MLGVLGQTCFNIEANDLMLSLKQLVPIYTIHNINNTLLTIILCLESNKKKMIVTGNKEVRGIYYFEVKLATNENYCQQLTKIIINNDEHNKVPKSI